MRKIYMKLSKDKYELPEAVADSAAELARMVGTTENVVYSSISRGLKTYVRVEVEDDFSAIRKTKKTSCKSGK